MNRTRQQLTQPYAKGAFWGIGCYLRPVLRLVLKLRLVGLMLVAALFLSGCVQYDVGIYFNSQTHGEIVQHIKLEERLTSFSGDVAQDWLKGIEQRTHQLGGKARRTGPQELVAKIPFSSAADLEAKFNQFFQSAGSPPAGTALPELATHLDLFSSNFLLLERDRLSFDLDLRPLGVLSSEGNLLISPGNLIRLEFRLNTPWGARSMQTPDHSDSALPQQGRQLTWVLQPGQLNHLEAVFWVPSPLGIGTLFIALLIAAGIFLRSKLLPEVKHLATSPLTQQAD